ncbi:TPA: hypothetical protein CPT87_03040 [Candidatus Gastranaerophilales bacterium HUM_5]|nr:MAG TPA: hypothetical protein CPT99_07510 [Candidatus Gastranaerophilales bacterium HUM_4]DAA91957.1 MAG TPA: hypothetical protein CPT87_03040 [Candidatus Gastranaerophilales bacterium HUM_5]
MKNIDNDCPICGKNDAVIANGRTQYYCKRCDRYFKPGAERIGYPKELALVLHSILALFNATKLKTRKLSLKDFKKKIVQKRFPTICNPQIEYKVFKHLSESTTESRMNIDADIKDVVILAQNGNSFFVVNELAKGKKITFNDCIVQVI